MYVSFEMIWIANILFRIFASVFMSKVVLFITWILPCFVIKIMLALSNKLLNVFFFSVFLKNLCSLGKMSGDTMLTCDLF